MARAVAVDHHVLEAPPLAPQLPQRRVVHLHGAAISTVRRPVHEIVGRKAFAVARVVYVRFGDLAALFTRGAIGRAHFIVRRIIPVPPYGQAFDALLVIPELMPEEPHSRIPFWTPDHR